MSRGVLLPASSDPLLVLLTLKFWRERWQDSVNNVYICYNHTNLPTGAFEEGDKKVVTELLTQLIDPRIHLIFHPHQYSHGSCIKELLTMCHDEYVMLLEEDAYIFNPTIVNECFTMLEQGQVDIVGSARFSCSPEVAARAKEVFSLNYEGYGDKGPGFWPNFFFCKKETLLTTDQLFDSTGWKAGDYEPLLDYTFKEDNAADTFVKTSLELHKKQYRMHYVSQHKASPTELQDKQTEQQNWHPSQQPFPWIHAGSLSSGYKGYLTDPQKTLPDTTESIRNDFATRVAFWSIAADTIEFSHPFKGNYRVAILDFIKRAGLDKTEVEQKIQLYKQLLGL